MPTAVQKTPTKSTAEPQNHSRNSTTHTRTLTHSHTHSLTLLGEQWKALASFLAPVDCSSAYEYASCSELVRVGQTVKDIPACCRTPLIDRWADGPMDRWTHRVSNRNPSTKPIDLGLLVLLRADRLIDDLFIFIWAISSHQQQSQSQSQSTSTSPSCRVSIFANRNFVENNLDLPPPVRAENLFLIYELLFISSASSSRFCLCLNYKVIFQSWSKFPQHFDI